MFQKSGHLLAHIKHLLDIKPIIHFNPIANMTSKYMTVCCLSTSTVYVEDVQKHEAPK